MLEDIIVIGAVMILVQIAKLTVLRKLVMTDELFSAVSALLVLLLAGGLQVANAAVFDPAHGYIRALGEGLRLGAIAGGIYSIGRAALGLVD